jgi:hypothetical protein
MTLQQTLETLDILSDPANIDVLEYIKTFDGDHGFSYTVETDPARIALKKKMSTIIDEGPHSGASWGCMLRLVQAVLKGVHTYEELVIKNNEQEALYKELRRIRNQEIALNQQDCVNEDIR